MPRYTVNLRVMVEVEAPDEWRAQDIARDLLLAPTVQRYLMTKCEAIQWEEKPNA